MRADLVPEDTTPVHPAAIPDDAVQAKLFELLGLEAVPERVEFEVDSEKSADGGMTLTRLHFANALGESVPGVLLVPETSEGTLLPGVVCLPGTGGGAERLAHEDFGCDPANTRSLIGWARELARRGFATLSITLKGCRQRRVSAERWEREAKSLAPYGRMLMGVLVDEALRAARVLGQWEAVAPGRIGLAGISLGGNATWYAMACASWIGAAVPVCGGVGSLASVIHEGDPGRHSSYFYIPHMLRFFDHARIVETCIAPRPFMVIAPIRDEDMPSNGVDELIRQVAPVYAAAGAPERFEVHRPDTIHAFFPEFFERMAGWFKTHLAI